MTEVVTEVVTEAAIAKADMVAGEATSKNRFNKAITLLANAVVMTIKTLIIGGIEIVMVTEEATKKTETL